MLGIVFLITKFGEVKLSRYILLTSLIISLLTNKLKVPSDLYDCPNCFGNELCESIANGDIQLHWSSKLLLILHPKLTKSVFFGKLNNSKDVVLKSMTRRDQILVRQYQLPETELGDKIIADNVLINNDKIQNVILCPSVKNLYFLYESVDGNLRNILYTRSIWLDLQISIEPLLLKLLSSMKGMPVPIYYGACKDMIVKEFKGKALYSYYNHSWITRALLSVQLLEMAEAFTFYHESFIFYFTDISSDNIAVDSTGKVFLTDLDHVIISQRRFNESDILLEKGMVHVSIVADPEKLAVSPSDICKYAISDHNYFAVCNYILIYSQEMKKGLLHGIPIEIQHKYQNVSELLEECVHPTKYDHRIVAGRLLKQSLNKAIPKVT